MRHNLNITDTKMEEGESTEIQFTVTRDGFKEAVQRIADSIQDERPEEEVKIIREGRRNPVIKTSSGDKVYMKYTNEGSHARMGLARGAIPRRVFLTLEEMAEEAGQEIPERKKPDYIMNTTITDEGTLDDEQVTHQQPPEVDPYNEDDVSVSYLDQDAMDREYGRGMTDTGGDETSFMPPFSKEDARYHGPGEGPEPELDCKDCAHFIEGGGCHMVQGEIRPQGYCQDLYADFGVFARADGDDLLITLVTLGEKFRDRVSLEMIRKGGGELLEAVTKRL